MIEVSGDLPDGDAIVLNVVCFAVIPEAARAEALDSARRFLDELAAGWGRQVAEAAGDYVWAGQPDGPFSIRIEYQAVCANP
jgi:hypothetical protein